MAKVHHFDGTSHLYDPNNIVIDHTTNKVGIGAGYAKDISAQLHLGAGVAAQYGAPLKFNSGPLLSTVEAGAFEFLGNRIYMTPTTARETIAYMSDVTASTAGGSWFAPINDNDLTAPPGTPTLNSRYIIAGTATGVWVGRENDIATWDGADWDYTTPSEGYMSYILDEDCVYLFNGTNWVVYELYKPVNDKDLAAPAGGESSGDRFIVATSATGDWFGESNNIAQYNGTDWEFFTPTVGQRLYVKDEVLVYTWNGSVWLTIETIDSLFDTTINTISDLEILQYDNGTSKWINQTFAEALIVTGSGTEGYIPRWDATLTNLENSIVSDIGDVVNVHDGRLLVTYGTAVTPTPFASAGYFEHEAEDTTGDNYGSYSVLNDISTVGSTGILWGSYSKIYVTGAASALTTILGADNSAILNHATASATTIYGSRNTATITTGTNTNLYGTLAHANATSYVGSTLARQIGILTRVTNSMDGGTVTDAVAVRAEIKNNHANAVMTEAIWYEMGLGSTNLGTIDTLYGVLDKGEIDALILSGTVTNPYFLYSSSLNANTYIRGDFGIGRDPIVEADSNLKFEAVDDTRDVAKFRFANLKTANVSHHLRFELNMLTDHATTPERNVYKIDASFNNITDATRNSLLFFMSAQTDDAGTGADLQSFMKVDGSRVMIGPNQSPSDVAGSDLAQLGIYKTYDKGGLYTVNRFGLDINLNDPDGSTGKGLYGIRSNVVSNVPGNLATLRGAYIRARITGASTVITSSFVGLWGEAQINDGTSNADLRGVYGRAAHHADSPADAKAIGVLGVSYDNTAITKAEMAGVSSQLLNASTATWTTSAFYELNTESNNAGTMDTVIGLYDNDVLGSFPGAGTEDSPYFLYSSSDVPNYIEGDVYIGDATPSVEAKLYIFKDYDTGTWTTSKYGMYADIHDATGTSANIFGRWHRMLFNPPSGEEDVAKSVASIYGGMDTAQVNSSKATVTGTIIAHRAKVTINTAVPTLGGDLFAAYNDIDIDVALVLGTNDSAIGTLSLVHIKDLGEDDGADLWETIGHRIQITQDGEGGRVQTAKFIEFSANSRNDTNKTGDDLDNVKAYGIYDGGELDDFPVENDGSYNAERYFIYSASNTAKSYFAHQVLIGAQSLPGGYGGGRFIIEGSDSALIAGPHIQITTGSDDYPLFQMRNWAHDNISMVFDAYYDVTGTNNWYSSDVGSNYRLIKNADKFSLQYGLNVIPGSAVTWNNGWDLDTAGVMHFYGDLTFDGELTEDWDAGSYEIRAKTFQSDAIGTFGSGGDSPFIVASTKEVTNLNANYLQGFTAAGIISAAGGVSGTTGKIAKFSSGTAIGNSIMTESGTTIKVDGQYWPDNTAQLATVVSPGSLVINLNAGNVQYIRCTTGTGTYPIAISNGKTGGRYVLIFKNASNISGVVYSWPAGWLWPDGGNGPTSNGTGSDDYFVVGLVISPNGTILASKCEDFG